MSDAGAGRLYEIVREFPPLCGACGALMRPPVEVESVAIAECRNCHRVRARFLPEWLPTEDEDLITSYGDSVALLMSEFGHPFWPAVALARQYFVKFTDEGYCRSIGIPTQDEEFFWHEGAGMAARIHYYLALGGDPDPHRFIDWRADRNRSKGHG